MLGWCFIRGTGVTKDQVEAVKWFHKAAEQGYAVSQKWLGACYMNGWGVAKDQAVAIKWFREASWQYPRRTYERLPVFHAMRNLLRGEKNFETAGCGDFNEEDSEDLKEEDVRDTKEGPEISKKRGTEDPEEKDTEEIPNKVQKTDSEKIV